MVEFNTMAMLLAAVGSTMIVSSGDDGVSGTGPCDESSGVNHTLWFEKNSWTGNGYFPQFPASSPFVTTVGGTMGPEAGKPEVAIQSQLVCEYFYCKSYPKQPLILAHQNGKVTSGGGFSSVFPQPTWQLTAIKAYFSQVNKQSAPVPGFNAAGRGYPDVSFLAKDYLFVSSGQTVIGYGTSFSAPVFAGMISLLNSLRYKKGLGPVGYLNPTLYAKGSKPLFRDVTSGNNSCKSSDFLSPSVECCKSGFKAATGKNA
jgi:tripeptidyl-peptidase-1